MMFLSTFTSMFTGFIMSLIRIQEPYFKFLFTRWRKNLVGIPMEERDIKNSQLYINDSLATFLTSSLNVELVHVILESITKYTTGYQDPTANHLDFLRDEKLFKDKNEFTIDTIIIKNPEKWEVAKLPEFLEMSQDLGGSRHKTTIKRKVKKAGMGAAAVGEANNITQENVTDIGAQEDLKVQMNQYEEEEEDVLIINEDVRVTEYSPRVF
jgi:hypothetical protein